MRFFPGTAPGRERVSIPPSGALLRGNIVGTAEISPDLQRLFWSEFIKNRGRLSCGPTAGRWLWRPWGSVGVSRDGRILTNSATWAILQSEARKLERAGMGFPGSART